MLYIYMYKNCVKPSQIIKVMPQKIKYNTIVPCSIINATDKQEEYYPFRNIILTLCEIKKVK